MKLNYEGNSLKGGIYKIVNSHNGRIYIGSTSRFQTRWWNGHAKSLLKEKHQNRFLQADFNKCRAELGHDDFLEFSILEIMEESTKEERKLCEQKWLDQYFDNGNQCYNLKALAVVSREAVPSRDPNVTRERISMRSKKMWASVSSEEKERRMQLFQAGKNEEWKAKISESLTGRKLSPEHVESLKAVALRGSEHARYGIPNNWGTHTPEAIEKIRKASTGRKPAAESLAKRSGANHWTTRRKFSKEAKEKMSKSHADSMRAVQATKIQTGEKIQFQGIGEAARVLGLHKSGVQNVLKGKCAQTKGWYFEYLL